MNDTIYSIEQQDLNKLIVVALERLSQAFRILLWDHAKQEKLSPIQIQFLVFIAAHPKQQSFVTEIAREFNLTPATVSDAVKSLDQKGLVQKTTSKKDKRRYFLKLTDAGKNITKNLSGWQHTLIEHLEQFPVETRQTVMLFLLEFIESLKRGNVLAEVRTCLSCGYFQRDVHTANESPHLCLLREVSMKNLDLRIDCPNYKSKNKN